ncbi:DUF874 family protein [Caballeronia novacaledonica]|uniref:Uncharacterized protein n=1 Tax=Caballeronia novacaledonica TaxID=1544861 RepID=A0AA37IJ50_9BURK|nr:DUF874 family protein [Caballeronia novacaledonica]GJH30232.1 hypothetical protein CBA19CS42_36970 [Caballeronia novacaledonica]
MTEAGASTTVLSSALTLVGSGVATALVSYFLGRAKSKAEMEKMKAETEKTRAEMEKIKPDTEKTKAEMEKVKAETEKTKAEMEKMKAETEKTKLEMQALTTTVSDLAVASERTLFDGTETSDYGFTVRGSPGFIWGKDGKPASARGEGELVIEDGMMNVKRTNTDGRFELWFEHYSVGENNNSTVIPKNELMSGDRKLRVSCEAKAAGAKHTLRFLIRNPWTGDRLFSDTRKVEGNEWKKLEVYLKFDPAQDVIFRMDDEGVSAAPSSVQIRKVVITERIG